MVRRIINTYVKNDYNLNYKKKLCFKTANGKKENRNHKTKY